MVDIYIRTLRLWYDYKVERRKQIMSKLGRQVIRALNIKAGDTQGQTEPVHDPYKDSLDNVLDSNIDDTVASTIDIISCSLRRTTSATQPGTSFDVLLPSGLFSEAASGGDKNSSPSAKRSSSLTFPPSTVSREPSNPLLRPSGNYGKLRKRKLKAIFTSRGLGDSGYITDQSGSQGASAVSKTNPDGTECSWRNQTKKGSSVVKEMKGDVGPDVSIGKLNRENSMVGNLILDDSDLMLVSN